MLIEFLIWIFITGGGKSRPRLVPVMIITLVVLALTAVAVFQNTTF